MANSTKLPKRGRLKLKGDEEYNPPSTKPKKKIESESSPLPSSESAEKAILSGLMQMPDLMPVAIESLPPEAMYMPTTKTMYLALIALFEANNPIDPIALHQYLSDHDLLDRVGGDYEIATTYSYSGAEHLEFYIEIVIEKWQRRKVIEQAQKAIDRALNASENDDVGPIIDEYEADALAIRYLTSRKVKHSIRADVIEAVEVIEAAHARGGAVTGVSTGFHDLDVITAGLQDGEMSIIAARPSMGKTAFLMNIIESIAVDQKVPCAIFSLEMSRLQLMQRLLSARSRVDLQRIRTGMLSQKVDFPRICQATNDIANSKLHIEDPPVMTILELKAKARRLKREFDIQVLAIDYLQLIKGGTNRGRDNRQVEVSDVSAGIKQLAKELKIPIIVAAQLNRNPDQRATGKPRLSDLRESGSIEQDADLVGLLHRDKYYGEQDTDTPGKSELIIAKQRNGPTGDIPLTFVENCARFETRTVHPNDFD